MALQDVEEIQKSSVDKDNRQLPDWTELILPYAKFDHEMLELVLKDHGELFETISLLQWNLYRSYMHGRWIYEKGLEAMFSCPEAYGVYSIMANWNSLRTERIGSSRGAAAFGKHLAPRVAKIYDLPDATQKIAAEGQGLFSYFFGKSKRPALSEQPMKIARSLTSHAEANNPGEEFSWTILANLIAEEQFVEAANMLDVAGNAVEHSKAELVEKLLPLVKEHRYAPYIKKFAFSPAEVQQAGQLIQKMDIHDARGNMKSMFSNTWQMPFANGMNGYELSWWAIWSRNHTQSGLADVLHGVATYVPGDLKTYHYIKFNNEFQEISPHSCNAIRLKIKYSRNSAPAHLAEWENELKEDPIAWFTLGRQYDKHHDWKSSARCYQRSLNISPSFMATKGLADAYYREGKKDLWQLALESYLEEEDLSLSHAKVHQLLAKEHIRNRAWQQAEPHALQAAQTYSAWGLELASQVYEGMQDWEKSEYFIAEAARNYPSYGSGTGWYFWCRRTGQGDLEQARVLAKRSIEIAARKHSYDGMLRTITYHLLEGDVAAALAAHSEQFPTCKGGETPWNKSYRLLHLISMLDDLNEEQEVETAIKKLLQLVHHELKEDNPRWVDIFQGECKAFSGEPLDEEFFKKFDDVTANVDAAYRTNHCYFLAVALNKLGQTELADKYLRRAAFAGPFDRYNSTLAGNLLVQRHGKDRGGMPKQFADQEAKAAEETSKQEQESESDPSI